MHAIYSKILMVAATTSKMQDIVGVNPHSQDLDLNLRKTDLQLDHTYNTIQTQKLNSLLWGLLGLVPEHTNTGAVQTSKHK